MRHHLVAALLITTLSTALFADPPARPASPAKSPFTLAKETTVITSPLLPDGTPDYLSALNNQFGTGIAPQTNALFPLLKIRGTHPRTWGFDNNEILDQFLKLAGTTRPATDPPLFEEFTTYQHNQNRNVPKDFSAQFTAAQNSPWTAAQYPDLAAYLQAQSSFFDLATDAANRPRLFLPFVAATEHIATWQPVSFTGLAPLGRAWTARALLRAGTGDLDAARADFAAIRRLARLFASSGTFSAVLMAYTYESLATTALASIASAGTLTEAQCDAFIASLNLPPLPALSIGEPADRYMAIDQYLLIARKISNPVDDAFNIPNAPSDALPFAKALTTDELDWNTFLTIINEERDQERAILDAATPEQSAQRTQSLAAALANWSAETKALSLEKSPTESPTAFATRLAHAILQRRGSALVSQDAIRFSRTLRAEMLPALLAAAKAKARTHQWPATLAELTPTYLAKIPADPYATNPATLITLHITHDRAIITSVGPDHEPNTPDDLSLPDPPR